MATEARTLGNPTGSLHALLQTACAHRKPLALWLVAGALLVFLLPLYQSSRLAETEALRVEQRSAQVASTITSMAGGGQAQVSLQRELDIARSTASALQGVEQEISLRGLDWTVLLEAVADYPPDILAVTSLTQEGWLLKLHGLASDDAAVVAYVNDLESTGLFTRVSVQSIERLAGTLEAGGASSGDATAVPTPRATLPAGYDDSDEDSEQGGSLIVPGAPHVRTFHTAAELHRARFVAKEGRTYRVYTSDLAPGVDTVLSLGVGSYVQTNDDVQPGLLSSEITIVIPRGRDWDAFIEVANRGISGPAQSYRLSLVEVLPPATPTMSPSPVPTSTPTATATPTVTPTPTMAPDLRDSYEPDEDQPATILLGEVQRHTFYPEGDVDHLVFVGQAGRTYRVFTLGLASGVVTHLTVRADGAIYQDYDRALGDRSQVFISFAPEGDCRAEIQVNNSGRYGPAQYYHISIEDTTSWVTQITPEESIALHTIALAHTPTPAIRGVYGAGWLSPATVSSVPVAYGRIALAAQLPMEHAGLEYPRVRFALLLEVKRP